MRDARRANKTREGMPHDYVVKEISITLHETTKSRLNAGVQRLFESKMPKTLAMPVKRVERMMIVITNDTALPRRGSTAYQK